MKNSTSTSPVTIASLFTRKGTVPWVTLSVILCCIVMTTIYMAAPHLYHKLAWSNHPTYPWQYLSGAFLHGDHTSDLSTSILHLTANILLFTPYAIIIENLIGHRKFGIMFLSTWLGISVVFQIIGLIAVPSGEDAYGNGLSGSAFAVIAIGAFVLFQLFKADKKLFFRQPLAYIF